MASPIDGVIGKVLNKLPNDPKVQLQYMYYLNGIIVLTLLCFSASNFYTFFKGWNFSYLFGGILTCVFLLMSLFSFKQTRMAYLSMNQAQNAMQEKIKDTITPEMIEEEMKKRNIIKSEGSAEYVG